MAICLYAVNEQVTQRPAKARNRKSECFFRHEENHGFFCIFLHFSLKIRLLYIHKGFSQYFVAIFDVGVLS